MAKILNKRLISMIITMTMLCTLFAGITIVNAAATIPSYASVSATDGVNLTGAVVQTIPIPALAADHLKLSIISDDHLFSSALGVTGSAFERYIAHDRKMVAESEPILDTALDAINHTDSNVVLVTGDLTKDGEKADHQLMAQKLAALKSTGKKVYVINGNHDVSNAAACRYDGDTTTPVDSISPSEFKTIYNDYGYSEAIAQDANSLSYVVEPVPGCRIIAIDACVYSKDGEPVSSKTEGEIKADTLTWIKVQIADAKIKGKSIVAMMHHGLVPHFTVQPDLFPQYLVKDYANVANQLADAGLSVVFTGHFHAQDITSHTSPGGNIIYDVETGSLVTYPCPIRTVEIKDNKLTAETKKISTVNNLDLKGKPDFQTYAADYLMSGLADLVSAMLDGIIMSQSPELSPAEATSQAVAVANMGVDQSMTLTLGQFLANCMFAHYAGDEVQDTVTQAVITSFIDSGDPIYQLLGVVANSLTTDLSPSDNSAEFNLSEKVPQLRYSIPINPKSTNAIDNRLSKRYIEVLEQ